MQNSQTSCSNSKIFVCTAILCWDYFNLTYSFFNLTKCTPTPIYFRDDFNLIPQNNQYLKLEKSYSINGFICSNCTRSNFLKFNLNKLNQCTKQITRIKLQNYCHYSYQYKENKNFCRCFPSDQVIQPITDWIKALDKPGKFDRNTNRANDINESASLSVYLLVGSIFFLVIFGGIVGMIFYWLKLRISPRRVLK